MLSVGHIAQVASPAPGRPVLGVVLHLGQGEAYLCPLTRYDRPQDRPQGAIPVTASRLTVDEDLSAHAGVPSRSAWHDPGRLTPVGAVDAATLDRLLRELNRFSVAVYADAVHVPAPFVPGTSPVPVSGRVFGRSELETLSAATLDFWLTTGRFDEAFCARLARFLGAKHVLTTNSGSSANLLAVSALTSPKLGDRRLVPGDEVITVAAGFPTTVNPILQNGLVPVFVDVDLPTYNIDPGRIEAAIGNRTRAIILAHTLGNPFDLDAVLGLARKHDLWVIEDCCDALGAQYDLPPGHGLPPGYGTCGTFGHLATFSFYPAHHITMGEGGAVVTGDDLLARLLLSYRDWGRDCWCKTGHDATCHQRFSQQFGNLPQGYDHKYVYSHLGYNLKITDLQAAIGVAQMERLPGFLAARQQHFDYLRHRLAQAGDSLVLPRATPRSRPAWFGMPLRLREGCGLDREDLLRHLNRHKIGTRLLFGGNLVHQPSMAGQPYKVSGNLDNTDRIMRSVFWIGLYPGLDEPMLDYACTTLLDYLDAHAAPSARPTAV